MRSVVCMELAGDGGMTRYPAHSFSSSGTWLLSVLRIMAGFLFIAHGTQKLFNFPPSPAGPAELSSLMWLAGLIEVVGGGLLLLGLLTRPVAFVLSGEMAWAYFRAHAPQAFWPVLNGGELAALYCFLFLYFAAAGAGPISLDAMLASWRWRTHERLHPPQVHAGHA